MTTATHSAATPRRGLLRMGLVLSALGSAVSAVPAVAEVGLDGSAWDVVVIALAILCPAIALTIVVLTPFAWNGRRGPTIAVLIALAVSILTILPAFFLAPGEVPSAGIIAAVAGLVLTVGVMVLIAFGAGLLPARARSERP